MDIVPFEEWAGRPLPPLNWMRTPTSRVVAHHGAAGTSSVATLRGYLRHHTQGNGWITIGYNFCVAAGEVFEGRGAGVQGAHAQGHNATTHGIVVAGDYDRFPPADRDLDALAWLLGHGVEQGWWERSLVGHQDVGSTSCPGKAMYLLLPSLWDRQLPTVEEVDPLADYGDELARIAKATETAAREAVTSKLLLQSLAESEVARFRRELGMPEDPVSDEVWSNRIAGGGASLRDARVRLAEAAADGA